MFVSHGAAYLARMQPSTARKPTSDPEPPAARRRAGAAPGSFAEVINLWPSAAELAAVLDVEAVTVRAWRRRGIPARYWSAVAEAARKSGRPVDERLLAELASVRRARLYG
ncbi:carph-isopro domain-containing protein [Elioraea sp.]|uniref:carph-isopro domain-containing protein n=1 Tax=Elioraea sp. TaxID=2185103 RepID=UPI003F7156FA